MWKKDEMPDAVPAPRAEAAPSRFDRTGPVKGSGERATIGRSITISGEVTGDEDLLIQGRVDGAVTLKQHAVTVGPEGEVKASITARVVTVEGRVEGDLIAEEQVVLRGSALVEGDITAPRVVLEDGARFRGGVDMGETFDRSGRAAGATAQAGLSDASRAASASGGPTGTDKSSTTRVKDGTPQSAAQVSR